MLHHLKFLLIIAAVSSTSCQAAQAQGPLVQRHELLGVSIKRKAKYQYIFSRGLIPLVYTYTIDGTAGNQKEVFLLSGFGNNISKVIKREEFNRQTSNREADISQHLYEVDLPDNRTVWAVYKLNGSIDRFNCMQYFRDTGYADLKRKRFPGAVFYGHPVRKATFFVLKEAYQQQEKRRLTKHSFEELTWYTDLPVH